MKGGNEGAGEFRGGVTEAPGGEEVGKRQMAIGAKNM